MFFVFFVFATFLCYSEIISQTTKTWCTDIHSTHPPALFALQVVWLSSLDKMNLNNAHIFVFICNLKIILLTLKVYSVCAWNSNFLLQKKQQKQNKKKHNKNRLSRVHVKAFSNQLFYEMFIRDFFSLDHVVFSLRNLLFPFAQTSMSKHKHKETK